MSDFRFVVEETPFGPHTHVFIDGVEIPGVQSCESHPAGVNEPDRITLTFHADSSKVVYALPREGS